MKVPLLHSSATCITSQISFYTSNTPIIVLNSVISNLMFMSKIIYNNFKHIKPIRWLGVWKSSAIGGHSYPTGGLIYYFTAPESVKSLL